MRKLRVALGVLSLVSSSLTYPKEIELKTEIIEENLIGHIPKYNIYTKAGLDVKSEYEEWVSNEIKTNKKDTHRLGFEAGFEATRNIDENFELGIGAAYQNHTKAKSKIHKISNGYEKYDISKFDSIPLYAVLKYKFETSAIWKPYLKATLGYSFNFKDKDAENDSSYFAIEEASRELIKFDTKIKDDLYYGIGAGVEYNSFFADLMYKVNEANTTLEDEGQFIGRDSFDYSRVTLGFGYKFSF
ncbi:outer membrane beta-barrel protein [Cetobacterium sp.]|uniref:outer membrane beta-barrel protein n=2 Tax=Cetobacterium sp. TaxID=2071632 RepID=UPI003EE5F14A